MPLFLGLGLWVCALGPLAGIWDPPAASSYFVRALLFELKPALDGGFGECFIPATLDLKATRLLKAYMTGFSVSGLGDT